MRVATRAGAEAALSAQRLGRCAAAFAVALLLALFAAGSAGADEVDGPEMMKLDFKDAELTDVINAIAEKTGTNFIYDDRVRGRVTIISPSEMTIDQAYAVFESVLQVKGFTTVRTPGGALKVIPLREAKETSIDTSMSKRRPANRDTFITRLIPLRYIDATSIVNTLKPLVSKDAAIAAYEPTNTVILTESASNIRRLIAILESVDVETYREELAVIRVEFADASTMAQQISEIFGATVSGASASTSRRTRSSSSRRTTGAAAQAAAAARPASEIGKVRIITDARTNSLIVLAPRTQLEEVRRLVRKLDVPVTGGGRIHVYYLQHADAEELAQTLTSMITGRSAAPAGGQAAAQGGGAQAIRSTVAGLSGGISVTADPATNSLVIQASQEGYNTLQQVIAKLDVARPQVLVEALIMEVDVASGEELGFNALLRKVSSKYDVTVLQGTDTATNNLLGVPGLGQTLEGLDAEDAAAAAASGGTSLAAPLVINAIRNTIDVDSEGNVGSGSFIQGVIRAAASDAGTNILSAPHILTSDNEEAEIRVGDNIPIVTSRVDAATGGVTGLSTSVNVERQDIGVTLRVTPQITEGDTLRLDIFQEISTVNTALTVTTSLAAPDSGVALSKRTVENTVVVADGETVVVGGLIGDIYEDSVDKIPWLGDIPFFGWLFKSTRRTLQKQNLLVFLTPHIVRSKDDLEYQTIRKRQELVDSAQGGLRLSEREQAWERQRMTEAEEAGEPYEPGRGLNPVRHALLDHESRYPIERLREIERREAEEAAARELEATRPQAEFYLQAGLYMDEAKAVKTLTDLVDLGFDGALVSDERGGRLLYEVRVGPYGDIESARAAGRVLERSQGLSPSIVIESPESPESPVSPERSESPENPESPEAP